jgi:hypothetical protein
MWRPTCHYFPTFYFTIVSTMPPIRDGTNVRPMNDFERKRIIEMKEQSLVA